MIKQIDQTGNLSPARILPVLTLICSLSKRGVYWSLWSIEPNQLSSQDSMLAGIFWLYLKVVGDTIYSCSCLQSDRKKLCLYNSFQTDSTDVLNKQGDFFSVTGSYMSLFMSNIMFLSENLLSPLQTHPNSRKPCLKYSQPKKLVHLSLVAFFQ